MNVHSWGTRSHFSGWVSFMWAAACIDGSALLDLIPHVPCKHWKRAKPGLLSSHSLCPSWPGLVWVQGWTSLHPCLRTETRWMVEVAGCRAGCPRSGCTKNQGTEMLTKHTAALRAALAVHLLLVVHQKEVAEHYRASQHPESVNVIAVVLLVDGNWAPTASEVQERARTQMCPAATLFLQTSFDPGVCVPAPQNPVFRKGWPRQEKVRDQQRGY